jgi:5'-3' exoribonuclease 1
MDDTTSPILDFYTKEFEQDLNGKKQDWEAVVKIPFIDEKRLLAAMASESSGLGFVSHAHLVLFQVASTA